MGIRALLGDRRPVRLRLLTARAGHVFDRYGGVVGAFSGAAGSIVLVGPAEARRMIRAGQAVAAEPKPEGRNR